MRKFLDIALLMLFFVELSSNFLPAQVHEALGIIFLLLIVAHNVLNKHFYKILLRGNLKFRRNFNVLFFAASILVLTVSGFVLADYIPAPEANWLEIHLGAAIFATIALLTHLLSHASRHIKGKILYAASILAFILAISAIFGLPYVDRWFHTVKVNRAELLRGEKINPSGRNLIVYFSRVGNTEFPAEVDAVSGASLMIDGKKIIGNAQMLADFVQNVAGGDVFALRTEKIYPADYSQTVQVAKAEFDANELPKLKNLPDVAAYDRIILIYPLWWSDLPKPVENFLRSCDLTGKKIYPLVTHGGGGFGKSLDALRSLTRAEIAAPLDVYSSDVPNSRAAILLWLGK